MKRNDPPAKPLKENDAFDKLLYEYIDRLNAGEILDKQQIIKEHPEYADDLIEKLHLFQMIGAGDGSDQPLGTLGDYTLNQQIGRGGMGVVYDARQNSMDRRVALKVLPPGIAADERSFSRFMREAKTAGRLNHKNIVAVHAAGFDENTPYYAMAFVEGETLSQLIKKIKKVKAESPTVFGRKGCAGYFENLGRAFADVADGLQHAHSKGIIHRDIKPSNLMLDNAGCLRIVDFGLAQLEGQEKITKSGDCLGTLLYMSPEQAKVKKIPVDHRTDIYSLGATMYEMLTFTPPFQGKDNQDTLSKIITSSPVPLRRHNQRIPAKLETVVLKCLRKDAENRYRTAEALSQDLRRFVRGDPVEASPEHFIERLARWLRRHRLALLLAVIFVALITTTGWFAYSSYHAKQAEKHAQYRQKLAEYKPKVRAACVLIASGGWSLDKENTTGSRFEKMEALFSREVYPLHSRAFRKHLGDTALRSVHEAAGKLKPLIEELPDQRDAHYHLARACLLLGQKERARKELEETLRIDKSFVPALSLKRELDGESFEEQYTFPDLEQKTKNWRYFWIRGRKAFRKWKWSAAEKEYDKLITLCKSGHEPYTGCTMEAYLTHGFIQLKRKHWFEAISDFENVRSRTPACLEAELLLGKAYYLFGKTKELPECTDKAGALFEKFYKNEKFQTQKPAFWIAAVYLSVKDYQNAEEWAGKITNKALYYFLMTRIYFKQNKWKAAEDFGRKAAGADPDNLSAHLFVGKSKLNRIITEKTEPTAHSLSQLIDTCRRVVELDSENGQSRFLLRSIWSILHKKRQHNQLQGAES